MYIPFLKPSAPLRTRWPRVFISWEFRELLDRTPEFHQVCPALGYPGEKTSTENAFRPRQITSDTKRIGRVRSVTMTEIKSLLPSMQKSILRLFTDLNGSC
jgi:hypothetical protein